MSSLAPERFWYETRSMLSRFGWSVEERRSTVSGASPASMVSLRGVNAGGASLKFGSPTVIGIVRIALRPTGSSAPLPSVTSKVTDAGPR
jgi:hypothetical protein